MTEIEKIVQNLAQFLHFKTILARPDDISSRTVRARALSVGDNASKQFRKYLEGSGSGTKI